MVDGGLADGPAHLVEHLWFESGDEVPIEDQIIAAGAITNASTGLDTTTFHLVGAPDRLDAMLGIMSTLLQDPLAGIDQTELTAEWGVIGREEAFRGRWHDQTGYRYLTDRLYPEDHPYHGAQDDTSGDMPSLEAMKAWAAEHYTPLRATLLIVGDVPLDDVPGHLEDGMPERVLFLAAEGRDPRGACPLRTPAEQEPPPPAHTELVYVDAPVTRRTLHLGWSLPPAWRDDEARMQLAVDMLDAQVSTRFDPRHTFGAIGRSGCQLIPAARSSIAMCSFELADNVDAQSARTAIDTVVRDMWQPDGFEVRERLTKIQAFVTFGRALTLLDDSLLEDEAGERARFVHYTGDFDLLGHRVKGLLDTREKDVARWARQYLAIERSVAVVTQPQRRLRVDLTPRAPSTEGAWVVAEVPPVPDLPPLLDHVFRKTLENGVDVVAVPWGHAPYATAHLVFEGGRLREPEPGADALTDLTSYWGASVSMSEQAAMFGGAIRSRHDLTDSSLVTFGSSANLQDQIQAIRYVLSVTRLDLTDQQEVADREAFRLFSYGANEAWPWAVEERWSRLLGEHPAGVPFWEQLDQTRRARPGAAVAWQKSTVNPGNATLVVAGNIDPQEAAEAAKAQLASWKRKPAEPIGKPPPIAEPGPRSISFFDATTAPTELSVSCLLPGRSKLNDAAQDLLGELLWVAMLETLRDRASLTYTPTVSLDEVPGANVLTLEVEVPVASAPPTLTTLLELLRQIRDTEVPDAAVKRLAASVAIQHHLDVGGSSDRLAWTLHRQLAMGRPIGDLDGFDERVAAVTAADLAAQLGACVGHEAITVVGPAEILEDPLRDLGAVTVDWRGRMPDLLEKYGPPKTMIGR